MNSQYRNLLRKIMRTFYDIPESLVMDYIYHYEKIELSQLAELLCLRPNKIREYVAEFKNAKIILESQCAESKNVYYQIDVIRFVNMVKYRLIKMLHAIEKDERDQANKELTYKCVQCQAEYTQYDVHKLHISPAQDAFLCSKCGDLVQENDETTVQTLLTVKLYNQEMQPIFEILHEIDKLKKQEDYDAAHAKSTEMKTTDQTVPYEAKSLPPWFL